MDVVAEAADGDEAVRFARETHPDVILMDLLMPRMSGLEAIRRVRAELPSAEILALTTVVDPHTALQVVQAGAIGYLLKDTRAHELCQAIRAAAEGRARIPHHLRGVRAVDPAGLEHLTGRELDVLKLLAKGKSNAEIGGELGINERTVKTHVSHLLAKLGLKSRVEAALLAAEKGWVGAPH